MKRRVFTENEIKKLLQNKNIISIKYKREIEYDNNFKLWATQEHLKYPSKTAKQIFIEADFDMNILDVNTPTRRIACWTRNYKKYGAEYFMEESKRKNYKSLSNEER